MYARTLKFSEEHEILRDHARRFYERECVPHAMEWEKSGIVGHEVWRKAGAAGLLCPTIEEEYGGAGGDFLHSVVINEEATATGTYGPGISLHNDIVAPYIQHHGTEEQKLRWLPRMASGELVSAIAMTEPAAGSDLQGIRTTARKDGNGYRINGQKTFITNGQLAGLICVVCKTDPSLGAKGISLLMVETDKAEGFSRGRNLDKIGLHAQDTSELFFDDVFVPAENLLGTAEGMGFIQLMTELPRERLIIAISAVRDCERAIEITSEYVKQRKAFGKTIADFQNTKFSMAEMMTETRIARVFVDDCISRLLAGTLDTTTAAMAKYWTTDLQWKVIDACVQLHGGYGYMTEYPIARMLVNARIQRIYGGANEIMKELIGRTM